MGLLNAARTIAEGIAIGYNLHDRNYFTKKMFNAPHLLAPTATDLNKYNKYGTIIAGYHYDLNFITVHGKSRYPGLSIFLRNGKKVRVSVPDGCLIAQAAKQLEYITGGKIYAGFHEVCVNEATVKKISQVKAKNEEIIKNQKNGKSKSTSERISPLWRISSTMFSHMNSNVILEPIKSEDVNIGDDNIKFDTKEALKEYPAIVAQEQVVNELIAIGLHIDSDANKKGKEKHIEKEKEKEKEKKREQERMVIDTRIYNNNENRIGNGVDLISKIDNLIDYVESMPTK